MIESAIAEHLEVLGVLLTWIVGVLTTESIGQTHALDWLLGHAVRHGWFGDAHDLKDRRQNIDGVMELGTDLAGVFNALGPGDDHAIARAAEMRGDLLGPLERRIASPSPAYRIMRRSAWQPELVDAVQHLLEGRLEPIKRHDLVGGTRQRTLGARAVIADDVDDESVLQLAHFLQRVHHAAYFVIGVFEKVSIILGLACHEPLLLLRMIIPSRDLFGPRGELRSCRNHARLELPLPGVFAAFVPPDVEAAFMAATPI